MLEGDNKIVADLKTSNNLNGTYPISIPNNALITIAEIISGGKDDDNEIELVYDADTKKYISENTEYFLGRNREYELVAKIEGSELEEITATTIVPSRILIEEYDLLSEQVVNYNGSNYWEGVVGLTFMQSPGNKDRYGHFVIDGVETERIINSEGDTIYYNGLESKLFTLEEVEVGRGAVTDLVHRDGFLVDFTKIEDNYIEIIVRSPFPITKPNHVTDVLDIDIFSVTKAHYDYHVALHNIKKSQGYIFDEHALYNSNIKNGLGLFSSCMFKGYKLELR